MFIYETIPHPTQTGKLLAVTPKRESWRCNSATEDAFEMIGGTHWRGRVEPPAVMLAAVAKQWGADRYAPNFVGYTLSPAQARDLDAILRAGFRPAGGSSRFNPEISPEDRRFWHPEHEDEEFSREDALAMIGEPKRCNKTLELDFSNAGYDPQTMRLAA